MPMRIRNRAAGPRMNSKRIQPVDLVTLPIPIYGIDVTKSWK